MYWFELICTGIKMHTVFKEFRDSQDRWRFVFHFGFYQNSDFINSMLFPVVLSLRVSGCSDHFASSEKEAYECVRNVISTLNYEPLPEEVTEHDGPLYSSDELLGLAPRDYRCTLPVKLVRWQIIYPFILLVCFVSYLQVNRQQAILSWRNEAPEKFHMIAQSLPSGL